MKSKVSYISFALNITTFLLVLTGTILMMVTESGTLASNTLEVFKYFTFQSNIVMGFVAIIYAYYQLLIIRKKKDKIPHVLAVLNLASTTAVGLTFIIVVAFLAPGYGFDKMYNNANLFFHLLVPVVAIINYVLFTKQNDLPFLRTLFTLVHPFLYGVVYFIVVVSHNAYGNYDIDFYGFGAQGPIIGIFNFLAILAIAYAIGLVLFFINLLVFKKSK